MLDEQYGHAGVPNLPDQLAHLLGLAHVQACGRLVHQQQSRLRGERAGHLHEPPLTDRQLACRPRRYLGHRHPRQRLHRRLAGHPLLGPDAGASQCRPQQAHPPSQVMPDHHVLQHRHVVEEKRSLKGPAHAQSRDAVGRETQQRRASELGPSCLSRQHTCQQIEDGCLARAVGADESLDLPLAHGKADILHGLQAAEVLTQPAKLQERRPNHEAASSTRARPRRRSTNAASPLDSPPGIMINITIRSNP